MITLFELTVVTDLDRVFPGTAEAPLPDWYATYVYDWGRSCSGHLVPAGTGYVVDMREGGVDR